MDDWAMLWNYFYAEKPWWDYHERFANRWVKLWCASRSDSDEYPNSKPSFTDGFFSIGQQNQDIRSFEEKAFPDQYMFQSQVDFHGYKLREMQLSKLREERRT
jgi:kynureninase